MGLQIPSELANLLNELGYMWPKSDEVKIIELGRLWLDLGGTLERAAADTSAAHQAAIGGQAGAAIDSYLTRWQAERSGPSVLSQATGGAPVVGAALFISSGVVLALKITVIIQLTILLMEIIEAIATAPETFGGSLLEVPVFKKVADLGINFAINNAMRVILG